MAFFPTGIASQMLPQGFKGIGAALQTASPLLLAMGAGLQSGQGATSQMPMGLLLMQQQAKQKAEEEALAAGSASYGSWNTGSMASGVPAAMGASNTPPAASGPLAGAMGQGNFSSGPSMSRDVYAGLEQQFRLPQGYLERTAQIESGGNPNAQNPNSSAKGLYQFIDSTAAQYGVDPMDPVSSTQGAARLASDNASILRTELGREPTAGELYLAHQQGAGGAAALLSNPNAPAAAVVGADAVRLNGGDANMTAGQFAQRWLDKFGEAAPQIDPRSDPQVRGMLGWLAANSQHPAAGAVKAELEMRLATLAQQGQGQGITDQQAMQAGLQEAGQQPQPAGPLAPKDRYQNVPGVGLVDLYAEGGPAPVLVGGQEPMSGPGKLKADLDAGRITQEQFDAEMSRGGISFETNPDGTASFSMGGGQRLKPLTEGQTKDNYYLTSIEHAGPILDQYETALTGVAAVGNDIAGMVPFGEFAQSAEYQQAQQAVSEWGAPVLRKESGAALTKEDYRWLTSRYIPVAGDKPEVVAQKKQARRAAEAGIRSGMTDEQVKSVAKAIQSLRPGTTPEQAASIAAETAGYPGAPKIGAAVEGSRFAGGDPNDPTSWVK
jgi:hypothetical protein